MRLTELAEKLGRDVKQFVLDATVPLSARLAELEPMQRELYARAPAVDGKDGAPGAAGLQGEKGAPGDHGAPGEKGEHGIPGEVGPMGPQGPAGEKGASGDRGDPGIAGTPGKSGDPGAPGAPGPRGEKGLDGRNGLDGIAIRPEIGIDSTRTYREGIWASYKGGLVRAMRDTDALGEGSLEAAGWEVMVDGMAGIEVEQSNERGFTVRTLRTSGETVEQDFTMPAVIYRGVYKDGAEYAQGDFVTWAGAVWHCEAPTTKAKPDDGSGDWKLAVKRGAPGKDGRDK